MRWYADAIKQVAKSNTAGHAKIRQLWKIKYMGDGYYSIRSLYKSDKCMQIKSGSASLLTVGLQDYVSAFPSKALWKIESVGVGYVLQNCWTEGTKQCLKPSSEGATTSVYGGVDSSFVWNLTKDTAVPDMLLLIDKNSALPVTNPSIRIPSLTTTDLDDLGLVISFVSQTTNEQYGIGWGSSNTSVATVTGSTGVVTPRTAGSAVISASHAKAYNTVQYTVTVVEPEYLVNLDVVYDEGHTARHTNSVARIVPQLEKLQRIFWDEFEIYVNYSIPTQYESLADTCPNGINERCDCSGSECNNSDYYDGTFVYHTLHHKNDTNVLYDIEPANTPQTLRMAFTGHVLCHAHDNPDDNYDGANCGDTKYRGIAVPSLKIALLVDNNDNSIILTTIHEFGHFYGAPDHYGRPDLDIPTTEELNGKCEGNPYDDRCIYGEEKGDLEVDDESLFCEGCRTAIELNRGKYYQIGEEWP